MNTLAYNIKKENGVNPKKFALWLAIGSMIMFFAAFTSAYIVRKSGGNWEEFRLPSIFALSTVVIILSSVSLYWAKLSLRNKRTVYYRVALGITLLLGLLFVGLQYQGWKALEAIGVYLTGNPSGSFLFVISGAHSVHVSFGILFLGIAFISSLRTGLTGDSNKNAKPSLLRKEMIFTYWHFVDIMWVYLFLFFYLNHF